jgi:hypothetical protein
MIKGNDELINTELNLPLQSGDFGIPLSPLLILFFRACVEEDKRVQVIAKMGRMG